MTMEPEPHGMEGATPAMQQQAAPPVICAPARNQPKNPP